jgi:putative ABC transport system permease protein
VARTRVHLSARDYREWSHRATSFDGLGAVIQRQVTLNDHTERPERIQIQYQTPGLFTMLGQRMILGRDFTSAEGIKGNHYVVILSHRLWQSRFGGDPQIIGKSIRLDSEVYTIVGVTAPGSNDRRKEPLWPVLVVGADESQLDNRLLTVLGQLKPGVTLGQAQAEMNAISAALAREYPKSDAGWNVSVELARNNWLPKRTSQNLWLLMATVTLVLLIACANVANLLMARGGMRRKEVAVRAAIGATRRRMFAQLLTENLILCLIGGALGTMISWLILKAFLALLPQDYFPAISLNLMVLLFSLGITLASGLIFGSAPAWRASNVSLIENLKLGGGAGRDPAHHRAARILVIGEFALTITLLAAAGMALRSFWHSTHIDLGARTDNILTFNLPLRPDRFKTPEELLAFHQELMEKLEALPGARRVAISSPPPLTESWKLRFSISGRPSTEPYQAKFRMISPGFLETFGVAMVQGRNITAQDRLKTEPVVIVNEEFVRQFSEGQNPFSQLITIPGALGKFKIVGVYRDIHNADEFGRETTPELCVPYAQFPSPYMFLSVWSASEPAQLRDDIAALIRSVDRDLPMAEVRTMNQIVDDRLVYGRFEAAVYGSFAGLALLLASVGIYGVINLVVKGREREMGLRMALGASRSQVLRLILRQGLTIASAGLILGLGCAWLAARVMQNTLYGAGSPDLATLALVGLVLLGSAFLSCLIPALRAASVQPMVVLRND